MRPPQDRALDDSRLGKSAPHAADPEPSAGPLPADPAADFGELLLAAAGLETTDLEVFVESVERRQPTVAAALRQKLEVVPGSFLALPAADRLALEETGDELPETRQAVSGDEFRSEETNGDATVVEESTDFGTAGPGSRVVRVGPGDDSGARLTWVSERYALGDCLGEGGMARVFRAFDRKLSRSLALKFMTRDEPALVHRFLREARLQAQVRHDHVLDVYDTGELGGRPYIAMRAIEGCTLAEVREHTSLEEQVNLLVQAAEGLDAAHREGLIHRDVKPSNILVEEQSEGDLRAYVADFGIATEPDGPEARATLAGTPSYLAPELLRKPRGPVDRRTDVYSLGVTAYELFTGRRPWKTDDPVALLKSPRGPIEPPRHWQPSLPADLEAIVLRAMAEDPDERYPTARALADDLRRFLAGEVVEAHAATWAYRLTRFAMRYRPLVMVAGVAVVALLAASVVIAFLAYQANEARQRAELRRGQAEGLVHFMVVELRKELDKVGRLDVLDSVHGAALEYFAKVPVTTLSNDELARQSQTLYQIGEVRVRRGDVAGAVEPFEESLALAQSLADRDPNNGQRLYDLGQSYFWLGYVHWRQSDLESALPPFEAYRDIAQQLVEIDPDNLEWVKELSHANSNLGSMLQDLGDLEGALEHFERTLEIDRRLSVAAPDDLIQRSDVVHAHDALGMVHRRLGRLDSAAGHLRANLDLAASLVADEASNPGWNELLGNAHEQFARLCRDRGALADAERSFSEANRIFADLVEHDPENAVWQLRRTWGLLGLAQVALDRGEVDQTLEATATARQILDLGVERDPSDLLWRRALATAHYLEGAALAIRGEDAARDPLAQAIELLESVLEESPGHRLAQRWLAMVQLARGRFLEMKSDPSGAQQAWQRAEALLAPLSEQGEDGRVLAPRAEALLRLGRAQDAGPLLDRLDRQGFRVPELIALRGQ